MQSVVKKSTRASFNREETSSLCHRRHSLSYPLWQAIRISQLSRRETVYNDPWGPLNRLALRSDTVTGRSRPYIEIIKPAGRLRRTSFFIVGERYFRIHRK